MAAPATVDIDSVHAMHADDPNAVVKVPTGHSEQAEAPAAE